MDPKSRPHSSRLFPKVWLEEFSRDRNFKEDTRWIDIIPRKDEENEEDIDDDDRDINPSDYSDLGLFMHDHESSKPHGLLGDLVTRFQHYRVADLAIGRGDAGHRRAALIDDRIIRGPQANKRARIYQNPLTATGVYKAGKEKRFDHETLRDVGRRLIFVNGLDGHYLLALAHTTPYHEARPLREGISKYFDFETSIQTKIPPRGFPMFNLELHLPHFEFKELQQSSTNDESEASERNHDPFLDPSFLLPDSPDCQRSIKYGIYKARFSLILCGSDNKRWTAWGFQGSEYEESAELDLDDVEDQEGPLLGLWETDPIAGTTDVDGNSLPVDLNTPISDPREYFLLVFEKRIFGVWGQWKILFDWVKERIEDYVRRNPCNLSPKGGSRSSNPERAFDWTQNALNLLKQLHRRLEETIIAWDEFMLENGGISYFSSILIELNNDASKSRDHSGKKKKAKKKAKRQHRGQKPAGGSQEMSQPELFHAATDSTLVSSGDRDLRAHPAALSLQSIQDTFDKLRRLKRDMEFLVDTCNGLAGSLQLQMTVESNKAAYHNGIIAQFANSIISPVFLAATFFSMPQTILPVKTDFKSFILTSFVMMVVLRLLFVLQGWITSGGWALDKVLGWMGLDKGVGGCIPSLKRKPSSQAQSEDRELQESV